jgi:hypothetical protein
MNVAELRNRTTTLANACIKVSVLLPGGNALIHLVKEKLLQHATELSVKTRILGYPQNSEHFISRLNECADASNACGFWLELVKAEQLMDMSLIDPLIDECDALLKLFLLVAKKSKDKLE